MDKVNLKITKHEDKTSKGDNPRDYTRFCCEYPDGNVKWMSAFDTDLIKDLKAHENRLVSVGVAKVGDFWNLRKFHGAVAPGLEGDGEEKTETQQQADKVAEEAQKIVKKSNGRKEYDKDPVGLACEVFCALVRAVKEKDAITIMAPRETMVLSINAVKQAQEAFS